MKQGKPLRFLALALGGWVTVRVGMVWLASAPPAVVEHGGRPALAASRSAPSAGSLAALRLPGGGRDPVAMVSAGKASLPARRAIRLGPGLRRGGGTSPDRLPSEDRVTTVAVIESPNAPISSTQSPPPLPGLEPARPASLLPSRLSGGTWLIARPAGGDSLAFGQLGASQAGMRVTYAIGEARRVALSARISAPLRGRGREAALGVDWRPTRLPLQLLVEQRLPLDGGKPRPAAQLIGGTVLRLPLHFSAEGYAQAGGVYRRGTFADGSARLSRALIARAGYTIDLGAGTWGAAQRAVARLDTGPTLGLTLPAQGGTVRLAIDYRHRVFGRARPGSGPAVSLGSSF